MRLNDRIHNNDFPASYYAASRRDTGRFSELDSDIKTDVAIVGGGFTGMATALFLAEKGMDVTLLEQNQIGWGASGRNGGQVIGGFGGIESGDVAAAAKAYGKDVADAVLDMGIDSVYRVRDFVHRYKIECDLKWGYVYAATNTRQIKQLTKDQQAMLDRCYPHHTQIVGRDQMGDFVGSPKFIGGAVDMGAGHVHPLDLVRGEARAAESLGARIIEHAEVTAITPSDQGVKLKVGKATVAADQVVLAGNAYLGPLERHLWRRICPVGSYIVATEPLSEDLARSVMPKDFAACDLRMVLDYWRLSADRRMLFGGMANYGGGHPARIDTVMRRKMLRVFPALKEAKIEYAWGGNIGISVNRLPQIGKRHDRIYYAQGYSGHGVAPSHAMAKLLAGAVMGDASGLGIMARARHPKFPGGPLRHQVLALAMLWYRILDLFE